MPTKVQIAVQVAEYQRTLHPDARRGLKAAILALPAGDVRPLTDELAGLCRLRVGQHRVIFRHVPEGIQCLYAAPRATVYEYLAAHLKDVLG